MAAPAGIDFSDSGAAPHQASVAAAGQSPGGEVRDFGNQRADASAFAGRGKKAVKVRTFKPMRGRETARSSFSVSRSETLLWRNVTLNRRVLRLPRFML
jgi:hypothetical protein